MISFQFSVQTQSDNQNILDIFSTKQKAVDKLVDDTEDEFLHIRNQIIEKFYAEFDDANLKKVLDMVGCRTADCPVLIEISSIDYMIHNAIPNHAKRFIRVGEIRNKTVHHSETITLINDSASKVEAYTEPKQLDVVQHFEVNIDKTGGIGCGSEKEIPFTAATNLVFNFTKNNLETSSQSQPFVVHALPQRVILKPMTKMNVTYQFYQYEQNIEYLFDFELFETSSIKHPGVHGNNVMFIKSPLIPFLTSHVEMIKNLKYANPNSIRLEPIAEKRFMLRNFPANEKITNFGVELKYGKPESIIPSKEV